MLAEIPGMWSLGSIFSLFGIIYLIICCSLMKIFGFWGGMGWNCVLLTIGLIIVISGQAGADNNDKLDLDRWELGAWSEMCVADSGKTIPWRLLMYIDNSEFTRDHYPDKIYHNGEYYNFEDKIYAMHDPASGEYICSPQVFHPASLIYCPGMFCIPVILFGMFISSRRD